MKFNVTYFTIHTTDSMQIQIVCSVHVMLKHVVRREGERGRGREKV